MKNVLVVVFLLVNILFARPYDSDEEWGFDHIENTDKYIIVQGEHIWGNNENNIKFNGENGVIRQSKKTLTSENITDSEIMKNISLYYPKNLEQAYKELTKTLDDIKNKSRILDDIEFYNLVYESCIYDKTVQKINDLAYFYSKQKNINYDVLIQVYNDITSLYPNRTVAYLNLADAYDGKNETEKAKVNYEKYIDLMKKSGKETKIPKRVLEYK